MTGGVVKEVAIIEGEGEEKGSSRLSELVMRNCIDGDGVMGGTRTELEGVLGTEDSGNEEEGESRNSELETEKINDEEETVEIEGKSISQNSPV